MVDKALEQFGFRRTALHQQRKGNPGLEQISSTWDPRATIRLVARAGYEVGPGRSLGLEAVYTNAGLQSFAAGGAGYRYFGITLSGGVTF